MLKHTLKYLIVLFTSILATNTYIAVADEYDLIKNLSERLDVFAVSVLPPQERGWSYRKVHPGILLLGKPGKMSAESLAGFVTPSTRGEFDK